MFDEDKRPAEGVEGHRNENRFMPSLRPEDSEKMTSKFLPALLVLSALWASQTDAQTNGDQQQASFSFPQGKTFAEVPFELLGNAIYVSARMNGKGPFLFELDTGSCCSNFAAELADQMGMKPQGEIMGTGAGSSSNKMGLVKGKIEFEFANGLKLATEDANTLSYAGVWPLPGRRFYGSLGYDVLKDLVVQIDYDKRVARFYSAKTFRYSRKGQVFQSQLNMNYDPQFAGTFTVPGAAPVSAMFTLDTGAGGTILAAPLVEANHLMEAVRDKLPSPSHGIGEGQSNDILGRLASVSFGHYELKRPLIALSQDKEGSLARGGIGVNLGGNLLRRFTVTINYPGKTVALEPNAQFDDRFPADASGLVLKAEGDDFRTFIVQGIVPDSPAAKAGLLEGDVIATIDGKPARAVALWELQEMLKNSGHVATLTVRRGEQSFIRKLALRSLI